MVLRKALVSGVVLVLGIAWLQAQEPARKADGAGQADGPPPLHQIKLPPGFRIQVFASGVTNARSMARGAKGTLFVGTRSAGNVYAVVDGNDDHEADRVITIASGLNQPNGVAFRDGSLYVAEVNRVIRFDDIEAHLDDPPEPVVISTNLPSDRRHGWKFIRFGPDGYLYVPVGAPCNVCERLDNPQYASITRMKPDGSGHEVFASGIRNTVGFGWHPATKELWFTDNGRDDLGDDVPPDELNRAPRQGLHFGYPYCHGGDIADPEFGNRKPCAETVPPAQKLGAHVAAIGMRFYTGSMFPAEYRNQIFIAEHGSWNRSEPQGYRVSVARLDGNRVVKYEVFAEGWLRGVLARSERRSVGDAWARPVDLEVLPDGSMLLSDDKGGYIFRITYEK